MPDNSVLVPYVDPGGAVLNSLSTVAKAVFTAGKAVACPLYQSYPGFMTGSNFGSPLANTTNALLNDLCNPPGTDVPALPANPLQGGQCAFAYNVTYKVGSAGGSPLPLTIFGVPGPIRGIARYPEIPFPNDIGFFILHKATPGFGDGSGRIRVGANFEQSATGEIISVVPSSGGPDSCGSRPNEYPISQPPQPLVNFNTDLVLAPNLTVNVPVQVFAPITNLRPSLKIGDFNFNFDLGGIKISPTLNLNFNPSNPSPNPPPQPLPGEGVNETEPDELLSLIFRYVKRLRECQECDLDYNFFTVTSTESVSGELVPPPGGIVVAVGFNITASPSNAKREPGLDAADVLYAGWGWFSGNNYLAERQPIDSELKLLVPPVDPAVQAFSWTLRFGFKGIAVLTYKQLKNPLPPV